MKKIAPNVKSNIVTPVILAGGSGTRLWPLSRKAYPKQFVEIVGKHSLFQQSAFRLLSSDLIQFDEPIILTNSDFRFLVSDQLREFGIKAGPIIIEPSSKNTGPAILAACLNKLNSDPNAILLVAPSDHVISNISNFHRSIEMALPEVEKGNLVTFGITPDRPETGYGYLELNAKASNKPIKLKSFIEKPDLRTAKQMLSSKSYLWNAGIFIFRASDMLEAFKLYASDLVPLVEKAVADGKKDLDFFRLDPASWQSCRNVSIDYAVMEYARNLVAIPLLTGWSDLGDWESVWRDLGPDKKGNVLSENVTAVECENVLLRSESEHQHLVGLGLSDIVAITMPDAVLVANKNKMQEVKNAVAKLKKSNVIQAEEFTKDHRPWGWYEILASQDFFQVKRISVNPGASLSLQSHKYRSEHWVVVEGTAKVTVGDDVRLLSEGESVYVPLGAIHRLENPKKSPMILIEVQTGSYLGEDDIVRYDDVYARN